MLSCSANIEFASIGCLEKIYLNSDEEANLLAVCPWHAHEEGQRGEDLAQEPLEGHILVADEAKEEGKERVEESDKGDARDEHGSNVLDDGDGLRGALGRRGNHVGGHGLRLGVVVALRLGVASRQLNGTKSS